MQFYLIKSYAKINLSLGVVGKLKSGLHKIESIVSFLDLHDEIKIKKIKNNEHKIIFFGKFSKGIGKKNTVSKLFKIFDKKKLINNQKYIIKIKKNIPQKSGMGGGSMNAASIIEYFLKKKIIRLSEKETNKLSNLIGSDVKLGLEKKNSILFSTGKILRLKKRLITFNLVIKPDFGCSTKEIYKKISKFSQIKLYKNKRFILNISNILRLNNDLEKIAFKKHSKLRQLKLFMQSLPKVKMVRMTGSGSSIIAYFSSKNASIKASKILKKNYKKYWCILSKTI